MMELVIGRRSREVEMRELLGLREEDNFIAEGDDLKWLIAQLVAWPRRVDEQKTTNIRLLMSSAALSLLDLDRQATGLRLNASHLEARLGAVSMLIGDGFVDSMHDALDRVGAPRKSDDGAIIYGIVQRIDSLAKPAA
jgi:hypothetical protein